KCMKVGIICYNHFDATIPLGKYLSRKDEDVQIEFTFLLNKSKLNTEMINLGDSNLDTGFVDSEAVKQLVDREVLNYLDPGVQLNLFVFNSIRLSDPKNISLLFQLKNKILSRRYDMLHF